MWVYVGRYQNLLHGYDPGKPLAEKEPSPRKVWILASKNLPDQGSLNTQSTPGTRVGQMVTGVQYSHAMVGDSGSLQQQSDTRGGELMIQWK